MAFKINLNEVQIQPHPKFNGVNVGYVITKERHPELSITILELAQGVEIPLHTHDKEVDSIFILEGEGEIYLADKWQTVKDGDIIVFEKNELHGLKANKQKPIRCYIVHAPALW